MKALRTASKEDLEIVEITYHRKMSRTTGKMNFRRIARKVLTMDFCSFAAFLCGSFTTSAVDILLK
jgi:hypothetical protein